MPGTPPTSPRLVIPRYADTDTAAFSAQVNAITDKVDSLATVYKTGTHAARIAATPLDGLLWRETDGGGAVLLGTGTSWVPVGQLAPRTTAASLTANSGEFIVSTVGTAVTVTLPAPTAGSVIGITASSIQVSSTPVAVVYGTGTGAIYGPGLGATGSASFPLGTPNASVILVSTDGSNWNMLSGHQDSGWKGVTLGSGMSAAGGYYPPAARVQGDMVDLRGAIQNTSGGAVGPGTVIATVPAIAFPAKTTPANTKLTPLDVQIIGPTTGTLNVDEGTFGAGNVTALDGIRYSLV